MNLFKLTMIFVLVVIISIGFSLFNTSKPKKEKYYDISLNYHKCNNMQTNSEYLGCMNYVKITNEGKWLMGNCNLTKNDLNKLRELYAENNQVTAINKNTLFTYDDLSYGESEVLINAMLEGKINCNK